jgi:probable rRNA maturation factor
MTTPSKRDTPAARVQPKAALVVELVCDAGEWSSLVDAEGIIQQAADAVAAWPGLIRGDATVSIALSSDAEVAALNAQYRGKEKPTNVLSFPAGFGAPAGFLGDIILAEETVSREAKDQATPLIHHVQHLVVHGVLHLLGFDHETSIDAERMEALEIGILNKLGIANPYTGELDTTIANTIKE